MSPFPLASYIVTAIFVVFVGAAVAGALIAALSKRLIRGVCGLALCCVGLSGLYYFLHSPFLALMEILIYIGAVCITIIFAIMLAEPEESTARENTHATIAWGGLAILLSASTFGGLWWLARQINWAPAANRADGSVKAIGVSLLTTYSVAFELISLVLLVAILGALAIARGGRTKA